MMRKIEEYANLILLALSFLVTSSAWTAWSEVANWRETMANGPETTATIEEASTERAGHTYTLKLSWTASGTVRRTENVPVSQEFAAKVIALPNSASKKGDRHEIIRQTLQIKYLIDSPTTPLVVEDKARIEREGMAKLVLTAVAPIIIAVTVAQLVRFTLTYPSPAGLILEQAWGTFKTKRQRLLIVVVASAFFAVAFLVYAWVAAFWFVWRFG